MSVVAQESAQQQQPQQQKPFKVVYFPADEKKPVQEVQIEQPLGQEVLCLIEYIKTQLSGMGNGTPEEKAAHREALRKQLKDNPQTKDYAITEELLEMVAGMVHVDVVPLMNNKKATDYKAVSMYVDDAGSAKNLPLNVRASQLCMEVQRPIRVLGDAWVGSFFDNEDDFKRFDFTLADCQPGAPWMKVAIDTKPKDGEAESQIKEAKTLFEQTQRLRQSQTNQKLCNYFSCRNQGTKVCSRCKKVHYCSVDCQRRDWKRHKAGCKSA